MKLNVLTQSLTSIVDAIYIVTRESEFNTKELVNARDQLQRVAVDLNQLKFELTDKIIIMERDANVRLNSTEPSPG